MSALPNIAAFLSFARAVGNSRVIDWGPLPQGSAPIVPPSHLAWFLTQKITLGVGRVIDWGPTPWGSAPTPPPTTSGNQHIEGIHRIPYPLGFE